MIIKGRKKKKEIVERMKEILEMEGKEMEKEKEKEKKIDKGDKEWMMN